MEEQTALSEFIDDNAEYLKRFCNEMAVNNVAESTRKHIVEYLNEREGEQEALFVATKRPHKRLGKATIETITKRVAKRAGVNKKCTVHLFRRTLATTLYKKGMPLKDIAAILGNSVDILEKDYIILEDRDIERKYNMYVA